jgi:hypothetical protein
MKTKTRKTRNRIKMKAARKPKAKLKAKAQRKPQTKRQPKVKSHVTAPSAGDGKLLKMAPRPAGAEKKINVRFATEQDYLMVAAQAAAEGMSVNRFIVTMAMAKCGSKITA